MENTGGWNKLASEFQAYMIDHPEEVFDTTVFDIATPPTRVEDEDEHPVIVCRSCGTTSNEGDVYSCAQCVGAAPICVACERYTQCEKCSEHICEECYPRHYGQACSQADSSPPERLLTGVGSDNYVSNVTHVEHISHPTNFAQTATSISNQSEDGGAPLHLPRAVSYLDDPEAFEPFAEEPMESEEDQYLAGGDVDIEQPSGSGDVYVPKAKKRKLADDKYKEVSSKIKAAKDLAANQWAIHLATSSRLTTARRPLIVESETANRSDIHESHQKMAIMNISFCRKCGYWAQRKSQALRAQCKGEPPHQGGSGTLKRMLKGLHPDTKLKLWPDGTPTSVPVPVVLLD